MVNEKTPKPNIKIFSFLSSLLYPLEMYRKLQINNIKIAILEKNRSKGLNIIAFFKLR
jgi:hypothetical protein